MQVTQIKENHRNPPLTTRLYFDNATNFIIFTIFPCRGVPRSLTLLFFLRFFSGSPPTCGGYMLIYNLSYCIDKSPNDKNMKIMYLLYPEWKYLWGQIRKVLSSPIFLANTPNTKETQIFARSKQVIHICRSTPQFKYTNI